MQFRGLFCLKTHKNDRNTHRNKTSFKSIQNLDTLKNRCTLIPLAGTGSATLKKKKYKKREAHEENQKPYPNSCIRPRPRSSGC
jgi:hypothetical protein